MQCQECDRLNQLIAESLEAYHGRLRTPSSAKQLKSALMKKSLLAAARLRLHQAADHPELGTKSTAEDLDLVYGEDE
jgi:hypothetical protein